MKLNYLLRRALSALALTLIILTATAAKRSDNPLGIKSLYVDMIDKAKCEKNIVKDCGMSATSNEDQSAKFQSIVDEMAKAGGGKIIIPKGKYTLSKIVMRSNIHIMIEAGSVISPVWSGSKAGLGSIFSFNVSDESTFNYIENCSVRGIGGKYIIDYSDPEHSIPNVTSIRFATFGMVRNFLVADADVRDAYTKHCAMSFGPSHTVGSDKWEFNRPTNGEVRNCSIDKASPGYGLCQLHGSRGLYFEDLYAKGGITLRLETGAGGVYAGVHDTYGRNIVSEEGRSAMAMGPHTAINGTVLVDGITSIGSAYTITAGGGFDDGRDHGRTAPGCFADDSRVINIHGIYGENAQISSKNIWVLEPEQYDKVKLDYELQSTKTYRGPSMAVADDGTGGVWKVSFENITSEGFKYNGKGVVKLEELYPEREKRKWEITASLPCMKNVPVEFLSQKERKAQEAAIKAAEKGGGTKAKSKKK